MRIIFVIACKDLLLRWRDRLGFFWWMIGFPLLIAVLIGTIFAGILEEPSQPMQVAVVDQNNTPASQDLLAILERSESMSVRQGSLNEAQDMVRKGQAEAFIIIKKDFRLSPAILWGRPLPVAVGMDPSLSAERAYLQAALGSAAVEYLRRQWFDTDRRGLLIDAWLADLGKSDLLLPLGRKGLEAALETLRLEAKRDPAAAAAMNRVSQRALRDVNLLLSWIDRQFTLHVRLARLYQKMQTTQQQAVEHYLKAYRLLSEQRRGYQRRVEEMTAQGDPFNLRGLFFVPRTEVNGLLMDSRLAEIERILDEDFDLQPDDYLYDYE